MKLLYNFAINAVPIALRLVSPFHRKARLMLAGRRYWEKTLKTTDNREKPIWIHCASLGEFEQGRPIIEAINKGYPSSKIVITFFSPSGYEAAKDYDLANLVMYLPFDRSAEVRRFLDLLAPKLAIFVKYEFWHNYLRALRKRQVPTFLVSGIFRPDQRFFKNGSNFFSEMLTCFTHFFVQNTQSKSLLKSIGLENVSISGDTRFDRVLAISRHPQRIEVAERFSANHAVMVVGSSWAEDMEVLLPLIHSEHVDMKFIIAPHEVEPAKVDKLVSKIRCSLQLFSEADISKIKETRVLIVDQIGMLSSLYRYGMMAYIGGSFSGGMHNILEAAVFGLPVIFGKSRSNRKFQEAIDMLAEGCAFEVQSCDELAALVEKVLNDDKWREYVSKKASDFVESHGGATRTVVDGLSYYLD
jgi:3-deoxy-D-manno-octulosonic-acid transferase